MRYPVTERHRAQRATARHKPLAGCPNRVAHLTQLAEGIIGVPVEGAPPARGVRPPHP